MPQKRIMPQPNRIDALLLTRNRSSPLWWYSSLALLYLLPDFSSLYLAATAGISAGGGACLFRHQLTRNVPPAEQRTNEAENLRQQFGHLVREVYQWRRCGLHHLQHRLDQGHLVLQVLVL